MDGKIINEEFWDKDLKNNVHIVPEDVNHTHFYFYMLNTSLMDG